MTKKTTKRSLAMSILSLVLCLAMLIGSTYAWFSDKAETGKVSITAGNLDVEIVDSTVDSLDEKPTEDKILSGKSLFENEPTYWEPGMMVKSKEFKIANLGTLALQYKVTAKLAKAEGATMAPPVQMKVASVKDATKLASLNTSSATYAERKAAWDEIKENANLTEGKILAKGQTTEEIEDPSTGLSDKLVLVLFWEPSESTAVKDYAANKDNLFNRPGGKIKSEVTVNVFATQVPAEKDSFGDKYDNINIDGDENTDVPPADVQPGNSVVMSGNTKVSGTQEADEVKNYKGNGSLELESGAEIKNTDTSADFSVRLGGATINDTITLKGDGKISKPENGFYGVEVYNNTTVTIEGNVEVDGIYISEVRSDSIEHKPFEGRTAGKVIINGGKITGLVNVSDKINETVVTIKNGVAVAGAKFYNSDVLANRIKIDDSITSQFEWSQPDAQGYVKVQAKAN